MENRYLFRAKRIDNGKWVEGLLTIMWGQCHIINPNDENTAYLIDPSTICQCTGLKDKNGKMIWENDIIRYSYDYPDSPWLTAKGLTNDDIKYRVGDVFWQEWRGSWAVCGNVKSRITNQDVFKYCRSPNRTEVIGNIFDNKDLMEEVRDEKTD